MAWPNVLFGCSTGTMEDTEQVTKLEILQLEEEFTRESSRKVMKQ